MKTYQPNQRVVIDALGTKHIGTVMEVRISKLNKKIYSVNSENGRTYSCGVDDSEPYFNILSKETEELR